MGWGVGSKGFWSFLQSSIVINVSPEPGVHPPPRSWEGGRACAYIQLTVKWGNYGQQYAGKIFSRTFLALSFHCRFNRLVKAMLNVDVWNQISLGFRMTKNKLKSIVSLVEIYLHRRECFELEKSKSEKDKRGGGWPSNNKLKLTVQFECKNSPRYSWESEIYHTCRMSVERLVCHSPQHY